MFVPVAFRVGAGLCPRFSSVDFVITPLQCGFHVPLHPFLPVTWKLDLTGDSDLVVILMCAHVHGREGKGARVQVRARRSGGGAVHGVLAWQRPPPQPSSSSGSWVLRGYCPAAFRLPQEPDAIGHMASSQAGRCTDAHPTPPWVGWITAYTDAGLSSAQSRDAPIRLANT